MSTSTGSDAIILSSNEAVDVALAATMEDPRSGDVGSTSDTSDFVELALGNTTSEKTLFESTG